MTADAIKTFVDAIQSIGFVGLLILLAFPYTRKKLGFNGNGNYQPQIDQLQSDVANLRDNHLAHLQADITEMKEDISYIKGVLSK